MASGVKIRAPRNQTVSVSQDERARLSAGLIRARPLCRSESLIEGTILGCCREWLPLLACAHVDLLFLDPPYNLTKDFNGRRFSRTSVEDYTHWLSDILALVRPILKVTATVYICGEWL